MSTKRFWKSGDLIQYFKTCVCCINNSVLEQIKSQFSISQYQKGYLKRGIYHNMIPKDLYVAFIKKWILKDFQRIFNKTWSPFYIIIVAWIKLWEWKISYHQRNPNIHSVPGGHHRSRWKNFNIYQQLLLPIWL